MIHDEARKTLRALVSAAGLAFAVSALVPGGASAQTAKPTTDEISKQLLDNSRVHVSEIQLKPGGTMTLPNHPDQLAYLLTDASLLFKRDGRTPYQLDFKAGEATLLPADSTHAHNEGDKEVRAILVEIKPSGRAGVAPTAAAKLKRKGRSGRK
jgi:quercetin dioxygenase-like cupin family protein